MNGFSRRLAVASTACSLFAGIASATLVGAQQAPASAAELAAAVARARAVLATDRGRLWGVRLDTLQWMGFENGRVFLTADPHTSGYARVGALWEGPLPPGIPPSNTSVRWNGRRWAMVLLPLPGDSTAQTNLLIHEAVHVVQPSALPAPTYSETGDGTDLLDRPEGRTLLELEWRALAHALASRGRARDSAAGAALAFRAARYAIATPLEITRERALDVSEGMPEYTALVLTTEPPLLRAPLAHLRGARHTAFIATLDSAAQHLPSYVRGFPYYTGPAYGFLLDAYEGSAWRRTLLTLPDLQRLLYAVWLERMPRDPRARALALVLTGHASATDRASVTAWADALASRYGGDTIRVAEARRWEARERQIAAYRAAFVAGPTLRLRPKSVSISFNPRTQTSLGDAGTVMMNLTWKGPEGAELSAPNGALVNADWTELRVPLGAVQVPAGVVAAPLQLRGDGWMLSLPAGWRAAPVEGGSVVLIPPAAP